MNISKIAKPIKKYVWLVAVASLMAGMAACGTSREQPADDTTDTPPTDETFPGDQPTPQDTL